MNEYNIEDIYIYDTHEVVLKNIYYQNESDSYIQNLYFIFKEFKFCVIKDNEIIDIMTNEKIKSFTFNLSQREVFTLKINPIPLNYYIMEISNDFKLSKPILKQMSKLIFSNLEKEIGNLKYLLRAYSTYCDPKDITIKYYYNDNYCEYYDEYKEYKKQRVLTALYRNKNILGKNLM